MPQLSNCCTQYQTIISIASQLQQQPLSLGCHNYQFRDILQKMAHACLAKFTMSSLYDNILRQVWQSKQSQYCTVYNKVYNTVHFTCTVQCTLYCTMYTLLYTVLACASSMQGDSAVETFFRIPRLLCRTCCCCCGMPQAALKEQCHEIFDP